jgi:hypothetical protein
VQKCKGEGGRDQLLFGEFNFLSGSGWPNDTKQKGKGERGRPKVDLLLPGKHKYCRIQQSALTKLSWPTIHPLAKSLEWPSVLFLSPPSAPSKSPFSTSFPAFLFSSISLFYFRHPNIVPLFPLSSFVPFQHAPTRVLGENGKKGKPLT